MTTQEVKSKSQSLYRLFFKRLVNEKPLGLFGGIVFLLLIVIAILAPLLAPYNYDRMNLPKRLAPPSIEHPLGNDQLGRDVLSRLIYGSRVSVVIGLVGSSICALLAAIIGTASGYLGGKFDLIVQRFVESFLCFPAIFFFITIMSIVGASLWPLIIVLGTNAGIAWSRTVRSAVFAIRENAYIDAGRAIGAGRIHMLIRHVLPNVLPIVLICFSVSMAGMILTESTLSFLGLGVPPPDPTWGQMLSMEGRSYMETAWWLALWPGVALTITIFSVSMFGDAVRDLTDPRLRGGIGRLGTSQKKLTVKMKSRIGAR